MIQVILSGWVFIEGLPSHDRNGCPNVEYANRVESFTTEQEYHHRVQELEQWAWHDACNGVGDGTIDPAWYSAVIIGAIGSR